MPDLHGVYAVTIQNAAGERGYYRIGGTLSWDAAQDRWNRLDHPRFNLGRIMRIAGEKRPVAYFAVRDASDPDPRWSRAIRIRVKDCAPQRDRTHHVHVRAMPRRKVRPKFTAELSSERGALRRDGSSPVAAMSSVRTDARRAGLI